MHVVAAGSTASGSRFQPGSHQLLWLGDLGPHEARELTLARQEIGRLATVHAVADVAAAVAAPPVVFRERSPAVILLAAATPARWTLADAVALAIRWPLAPLVSVAGSLADGRRRSGPPLPGVEDVSWHDLAGRLAAWLDDREAGFPGTLGLPATARREERILEGVRRRWLAGRALTAGQSPVAAPVAVAALRQPALEGLAGLVAAIGGQVAGRSLGRPPLDDPTPLLVWEPGSVDGGVLAWLRLLVANQPGRRVILLDSFPRAETTAAAQQAGAAAILGLPLSAEALAGTLARLTGAAGS
jgi:hypothetical protein